jgi:hypothetical protein
MSGLLKKDFFWFAMASFVLLPLMLIFERLYTPALSPLLIGFNTGLLVTIMFGPVVITEQEEEKSSGYVLLGSLPITKREIVRAKFLLPLMPLVTWVAGNLALIRSWSGSPEAIATGQSAIVLTGAICLALCGLVYVGILGLGYTRFFVAAMFVALLLSLLPPLVLHSKLFNPRAVVQWVVGFLLHLNRPLSMLAGLVAYAGLMLLASAVIGFEPKKRFLGWY